MPICGQHGKSASVAWALAARVQQQLAPTLRAGDIVVLDNLAARKVASVREAIEQAGAKLVYLPPTVLTSIRSSWCSPS